MQERGLLGHFLLTPIWTCELWLSQLRGCLLVNNSWALCCMVQTGHHMTMSILRKISVKNIDMCPLHNYEKTGCGYHVEKETDAVCLVRTWWSRSPMLSKCGHFKWWWTPWGQGLSPEVHGCLQGRQHLADSKCSIKKNLLNELTCHHFECSTAKSQIFSHELKVWMWVQTTHVDMLWACLQCGVAVFSFCRAPRFHSCLMRPWKPNRSRITLNSPPFPQQQLGLLLNVKVENRAMKEPLCAEVTPLGDEVGLL